jgi:hypothetical protein
VTDEIKPHIVNRTDPVSGRHRVGDTLEVVLTVTKAASVPAKGFLAALSRLRAATTSSS